MTTIIQRAAAAAKEALITDPETDAWVGGDDDPDDLVVDGTIRLTPVVKAVLQAIREPSEAMLDVGFEVGREVYCADLADAHREARGAWQDMIDAALREQD